MKLFMFQPSRKESYVGGGLIIAADTFAEARDIFHDYEMGGDYPQYEDLLYENEASVEVYENDSTVAAGYAWVLHSTYKLAEEIPHGVVFFNSHDG